MEEVVKIWEDYILDIYIGLYKGTLEERMELRQDVCIYCMLFSTEGAYKSVQLHIIGSMCMTAPPYSNLSDIIKDTIPNIIVGSSIFLRPEEAMLKTWQKLVLSQQIFVYREYQNLVLNLHDILPKDTGGFIWGCGIGDVHLVLFIWTVVLDGAHL